MKDTPHDCRKASLRGRPNRITRNGLRCPSTTSSVSPCAGLVLSAMRAELFPSWRHHAFITSQGRNRCLFRCRSPSPRGRRTRHPGPQGRNRTRQLSLGDFNANAAWAVLGGPGRSRPRHGPVSRPAWARSPWPGRGQHHQPEVHRRSDPITSRSHRAQLHVPTKWPWPPRCGRASIMSESCRFDPEPRSSECPAQAPATPGSSNGTTS